MTLELAFLGPFAARSDGAELKINSRRSRALLGFLAISRDATATRAALIDLLWPDRDEAQGRASLRQELSALRRALGPEAELLHAAADTVSLDRSANVDVWSLDDAPSAAFDAFARPFLEDVDLANESFQGWVEAARRQLQADLAERAEALLPAAIEQGDKEGLAALARSLSRLDSTSEAAVRAEMELACLNGQRPKVLDIYDRYARLLSEEYDLAPSPELAALRDRLAEAGAGAGGETKSPSMAIFDRPSVLVVGFDCRGSDGRDSALALGLAQEVRSNLSYWRWLPVIGPEALGFKTASEIDVRAQSRELGAEYVLTGAVRSLGDKVRVNVTLSSVADGNSLWSHHFDGTLENLFDFEEEVSRAIVAQVEPELSRANSLRIAQSRPADLSAWQLLLKAGESQRRGGEGYGTKEANEEQKALLSEVLKKDPGLARAWAWLAKCYWRETIMDWSSDRDASLAASLEASQRAMDLNPTNWEARAIRASALLFGRKEFVESEFHAREAVRLNPSDVWSRHGLGCVLEHVGKTEDALEQLEAVFRLNPNHSNSAGVLGDIATSHMILGNKAEAVETALRLIALAPNYSRGLQRAIAALSFAGEHDRAREAVARLHAVQPDFNEDYVRTTYPFKDPDVLELMISNLREAGAFDVTT